MNVIFFALIAAAVTLAVGSSLRRGRDLGRVKGRPATFGDFHEPVVHHTSVRVGENRWRHFARSNGVELCHTSIYKRLVARPVWRDTPWGTEVGVELRYADGQVAATRTRVLDA